MNKRFKKNKMGSDTDHSKSMLKNLAVSLIAHESIETSKPKSREVRSFVEKLFTLAKKENTGSKRKVFDRIRNEQAVNKIYDKLLPRFKDRNSGYIRIIKSTIAKGNSEQKYLVSFVDYKVKDRRSQRRAKAEAKNDSNKSNNKGIVNRVRNTAKNSNEDKSKSQVSSGSAEKAKSRSGI